MAREPRPAVFSSLELEEGDMAKLEKQVYPTRRARFFVLAVAVETSFVWKIAAGEYQTLSRA